ncbi:MAG: hypothetical protein WCJ54_00370 [Actinomycetota bacterium]
MSKLYLVVSRIFAILLLFIGLISVVSGIVMIPTNGMGMPLSWLENTVFDSYLVPGLILALVIGGFGFAAGILLLLRRKCAIEMTASTGFALIIWIFTEIYLIKESFWLQTVMFIIGIIMLVGSMVMLELKKR